MLGAFQSPGRAGERPMLAFADAIPAAGPALPRLLPSPHHSTSSAFRSQLKYDFFKTLPLSPRNTFSQLSVLPL